MFVITRLLNSLSDRKTDYIIIFVRLLGWTLGYSVVHSGQCVLTTKKRLFKGFSPKTLTKSNSIFLLMLMCTLITMLCLRIQLYK